MKRRKEYMHRPGMRFDRKHVEGTPDAGFIGGVIDGEWTEGIERPHREYPFDYPFWNNPGDHPNLHPRQTLERISGTIQASLEQPEGDFERIGVPMVGYPRTRNEMAIATGWDIWKEGYLLEEPPGSSGITSSLSVGGTVQTLKLNPNAIGTASFHSTYGPRGLEDFCVSIACPASFGQKAVFYPPESPNWTRWSMPSGSDNVLLWVGKVNLDQQTSGDGTAFSKITLGTQGFRLQMQKYFISGYGTVNTVTGHITFPPSFPDYDVRIPSFIPDGRWMVGLYATDRASFRHFIAIKDLVTGEVKISSSWDPTGEFGPINPAYIIPDNIDSGQPFVFGGAEFSTPTRNFTCAAFYLASGSQCARNMQYDAENILNRFGAIILAKNSFLLSGSTEIANSLGSFGSADDTAFLNQRLLGLGTASLGRGAGFAVITTGSIPTWTNVHLGRNMAFVVPTLSSSDHEVRVLNMYRSGSEALEQTAVPASASLYYSKNSKYSKVIVKKSASYFDTVAPTGYAKGVDDFYPPAQFVPGSGSLMTLISSSVAADMSTPYAPGVLLFDVPVSGKLVDISVWVELHHQSGSVPIMPLGSIGLGLKSPNVKWGMGHPMLNFNDPSIGNIFSNGLAYGAWKDTFILWEGPGALMLDQRTYGLGPNHFGYSDVREQFPGWDRDLSMRTVFNDNAPVNNPRHNIPLGVGSGSYIGAPNSALGINNAWGMAVCWTGSAGSPPNGWLTGPGGAAAVNEWPTTGSNLGATHVKPLYPLLDPIEVTIPPGNYPTVFFGQKASPDKFVGTRPGLRGTEISGTWKLTFWTGNDDDGTSDIQMPCYFRQARLEITYESHQPVGRIRADSSTGAHTPGRRKIWQTSGSILSSFISSSNDIHVIDTERSSISRTFGVIMNTGSINLNGGALSYRLTGTLADYSGSAPGWLLNNEFGMPRIPLSSASLVPLSDESVATVHPQDILVTRPLLDGAQRLSDAARDASPPLTRADYAAEVVTGSLT